MDGMDGMDLGQLASWHLEFEAENGMGLMDLLPVPQLSPSKGMPLLWCNVSATMVQGLQRVPVMPAQNQ